MEQPHPLKYPTFGFPLTSPVFGSNHKLELHVPPFLEEYMGQFLHISKRSCLKFSIINILSVYIYLLVVHVLIVFYNVITSFLLLFLNIHNGTMCYFHHDHSDLLLILLC